MLGGEVVRFISRLEEIIIAISILFATILILVNVALRLMGSGITWSEELIRYLLILVTFIGMSVCARDGEHVSIEFIPQMLKGKANTILMVVINSVSLIFSIMLTWYSFQLFQFSWKTGQLSPGLGLPIFLIYAVTPLSGLLVTIRYFQQIIKILIPEPSGQKREVEDDLEGVENL